MKRYALNPDNGFMYESERGPWVRVDVDTTPQPAVPDADKARLDWLERQTVEVRVAQRYGSKRAIYEVAEWDEEEAAPRPSGLRAAIDAAMLAAAPKKG